jgi:tetratricopeptide (TPR) repeat protein
MQTGQSRIVFLSVPESLRGHFVPSADPVPGGQDDESPTLHHEHGNEYEHDDDDGRHENCGHNHGHENCGHDHGDEYEHDDGGHENCGHNHGHENCGHKHGDEYEHNDDDDGHGGFTIDPAIPIPVELLPGETALDFDKLSWEMIVAGMLRVIASPEYVSANYTDGEISGDDIDYYRRFVLSVKPNIRAEFTEAAILHARNGNFESAREILTVLLGLFPGEPELLLNLALVREDRAAVLERSGRDGEAETESEKAHEIYRDILSLSPPFPNGLFNAGFFYLKRRNFDKARKCFSAYLPLADNSEKREKARAIVREITSRGLDDEILREAYDFIRLGEEQKGLDKIRDFLERHPGVWNGWFILGWALRRLSRWEDGAAAFRKAVELGGDNSDTRNELAICLMELEDYAAARKELELALREESENIKIISNLGVLALKRGDTDEAMGFFRTVLEIEPDDPIAKSYLQSGDK